MPIHDWTRVEAGIFHAFRHGWISAISDTMNTGLLPPDLYALPEQVAAGFGPETEVMRWQANAIAIRHVSGDRIVAMIEIVSPGNKASQHAIRSFVENASELLEYGIHLLIIDLFPPGSHDPDGVHGLIWQEMTNASCRLPPEKPLTLVAYECEWVTQAFVESLAVGAELPEMPLFLEPNWYVMMPLDATYRTAFGLLPRRWRDVLQPPKDRPPGHNGSGVG